MNRAENFTLESPKSVMFAERICTGSNMFQYSGFGSFRRILLFRYV